MLLINFFNDSINRYKYHQLKNPNWYNFVAAHPTPLTLRSLLSLGISAKLLHLQTSVMSSFECNPMLVIMLPNWDLFAKSTSVARFKVTIVCITIANFTLYANLAVLPNYLIYATSTFGFTINSLFWVLVEHLMSHVV